MRVCHGLRAVFDDPNLVSCAGLAPVVTLAERASLQRLVTENTTLKHQIRSLTTDNRALGNRLAAARNNNRAQDQKIAHLQADLLAHAGPNIGPCRPADRKAAERSEAPPAVRQDGPA